MAEVKITQKLAHQTHSDLAFDMYYSEFPEIASKVLNAKYKIKNWQNNELIDFYSTYTYDVFHDNYYHYAHVDTVSYDTDAMMLGISDKAKLGIYSIKNNTPNESPNSDIRLTIYGKTLYFGLDKNPQDIHQAAMIYCYAMEQLNKMPIEEAYDSRFHKIKLKIEKYLTDLSQGKPNNLNLDALLSKEEWDHCVSVAKATTLKNFLMDKNIIPQENGRIKYPKTYDKLIAVLPKVEAKYAKVKERRKTKEEKVKLKAQLKQSRKDLRKAKIEEKKQLKAKQKEHKKEVTKSVRESNFTL